ncbi:hypothetical protein [Roseiconus lacunae]|uniref:Protein BatD n=1 Tax=Roseiconus lacunae TaxID=2605694 RepID=A0ABT7PBY5_9BACT|nr:hypothetical protein [Roseiconus lacunae]MDM4013994.1 hypothetical protein [Roseiconus lacunae]
MNESVRIHERLARLAVCLSGCFALIVAMVGDAIAEPLTTTRVSGPVTVIVSLEPEQPVIGDPVKLTIEVTAEKDVEVLMPDFGSALNRFSIVDFAPRQTIDDDGRTVATQTYRLDPPSSGPQVIPPILIEYVDRREGKTPAPEGLDAYEILTDRMKFTVESVLPEGTTNELKPPLGRLEPITPSQIPKRTGAIVAAVIVGLAVLAAGVFYWNKRGRKERRRSAFEIADASLQKLLQTPRQTEEQIDLFYVQLTAIIRQYIEDRFDMRAPELTTEEFLASISRSPDFSSEHQSLLRDFLRHADLVKFAGATPSSDEMTRSIDTAKRFLNETRQGGEGDGR